MTVDDSSKMITISKIIVLMIALFPLCFGCTNPSYLTVRPDFANRKWMTVAVAPFSGDARFRDVGTETFTLHMLKQTKFNIIEPDSVRVKASVIMTSIQNNTITVLEAQKIGQHLNVDAVVIGTVTSYNNGLTLNGWATVKLVETTSGQVIASSHKPSGLLFGFSEHQCIVKATERAAEDILSVLNKAQGKDPKSPVAPKRHDGKTSSNI